MGQIKTPGAVFFLSLFLAVGGCATTTTTSVSPKVQEKAVEKPAVVKKEEVKKQESVKESGIDQVIEKVVNEARSSMRSRTSKYKDQLIEANPVWDFPYKGEVHLRIYDASGALVREEILTK